MTTPVNPLLAKLATTNETIWMRFGAVSENMHDPEKALYCYENALRHNLYNVKALTQAASICRMREQYPKAVEYFQRILNVEQTNGEIWGALGHCYLMMDDLQKAYTAYQQALYHLPNPKDPNLWYGIGILYDRYGSFEHAEEAFTAVLKMDPKFEKANEIYFRLGIIYKQQMKHDQALDCFRYILQKPPRPLVQADIWFQIGHVYELQKDFHSAKDAYERVLKENPTHAKVLQQLGWLYHHNTTFGNQEIAISYLMRSIDADPSDGQTWYLLGRCYMAQQKYRKAYDAYQQAVYRDGRNPTFWCSIGVLYYQINQYRDALDAYSRAIRLNPYLSEVWYDLGTLYESCNQISDSLDAYQRAAELDPNNKHIQQRLSMLRTQISGGGKQPGGGSSNNKELLTSSAENASLGNGGVGGKEGGIGGVGENGEKVGAGEHGEGGRPAPIMTLEPRTSSAPGHSLSEGMASLRRPASTNGSIPNVPELVDLSREDNKPRLPSATELNSSLSDVKTAQKSADNEVGEMMMAMGNKPVLMNSKGPHSIMNDIHEKKVEEKEERSLRIEKDKDVEMRQAKSPSKDDDYYDRDSDNSDKEGPSGLQVDESSTRDSDVGTPSNEASAPTNTEAPTTTKGAVNNNARGGPQEEREANNSEAGGSNNTSSSTEDTKTNGGSSNNEAAEPEPATLKRGSQELADAEPGSKRQKKGADEVDNNNNDSAEKGEGDESLGTSSEASADVSSPASPQEKEKAKLKSSSEQKRDVKGRK